MSVSALLLVAASLFACKGGKDDDTSGDGGASDGGGTDGGGTDGGTTDGGTTDGGTDGGTTTPSGFTISGVVLDLATFGPAGGGLCIHALDPTSVIGGDTELDIVASSVIDASGMYMLENVVMPSLLGMFVLVMDCAGEGTVWTTATGIPVAAYQGLGAGDTLYQTALLISTSTRMGMEASMTLGGESHDLSTEGAVVAFVQDAKGNPVGGATVTCSSCPMSWYLDSNSSDGLFTTMGTVNTSTDAAAGALVVIPGGPLGSYQTSISDGSYTWRSQTFGSLPGLAVIGAFNAEP